MPVVPVSLSQFFNATEAAIKRLEKRLADLKAGKPLPKKIKREKSARELELEDLIEEDQNKAELES